MTLMARAKEYLLTTASLCLPFCLVVTLAPQTPSSARPLVPIDPVIGINDALQSHDVVGLSAGEGHGDLRGPEFIAALVQHPKFAPAGADLVLENGNAACQDLVDRYVRGEDVSYAALRHAWEDTTQPQVVEEIGRIPELYRAVRLANASRPKDRQLRALLADPPIDWSTVTTPAEYRGWLAKRDSNGAEVVLKESTSRKRHALLHYGAGHLQRKNELTNYQMEHPLAQTVVSILERAGVSTFIIGNAGRELQLGMETWPVPSLALLRGTPLGAKADDFAASPRRVSVGANGELIPVPRAEWIAMRLEDKVDALIYLGPSSEKRTAPLSPTICTESGYLETRPKRMAIAGLPKAESDRLQKFCASQNQ